MLNMAFTMVTKVAVVVLISHGGFAQLELNPRELRLTNGATTGFVNISCGMSSDVNASAVYVITISRYLKSAPTTQHFLAVSQSDINQGQAYLVPNSSLTQNTATVSGGTSQKSMTLTLTQANCEDAGTYVCVMSYKVANGSDVYKYIDVRDNFTVRVPSGNITMTADPQIEGGNYSKGTVLTLTCNGTIGTYDSTWSWQYQDNMNTSWTPYPNNNDTSMDPLVNGTSWCPYHQISRLTRNLTLEDSRRTYKCVVQANDNQDSSSAQYTLGIVADTAPTSTSTSASTSGQTFSSATTMTNSTGNNTATPNSATRAIEDHMILCFLGSVSMAMMVQTGLIGLVF